MAYDATKMKDWEIAEAAEKNMPTPEEWQKKTGTTKGRGYPLCQNMQTGFPENH